MLPESFITELKDRNPIEDVVKGYVDLKRKGRYFSACCPFHSEKTPSFFVYPSTGSYYCFGCGEGGDVITFIRNIEGLEYIEAVNFLAKRAGITVPDDTEKDERALLKKRIYEINKEAGRFFHKCLMSDMGREARSYLKGRGLTIDTIRHFGLGYSPKGWSELTNYLKQKGFYLADLERANVSFKSRNGGYIDRFRNRVMFPIIDIRGNVIGFGGRALEEGGAKYLNTSDTAVFNKSRNLFALNFAKDSKERTMILAEGYMDVISLHQAGFVNTVATLGTSLTAEQARLLSSYTDNVVISYDSDGAGQKAALRAIGIFSEIGLNTSVLKMTGAKDPDEYIKKFGRESFKNLISDSKGVLDFEISKLYDKYNKNVPEEKEKLLNEFCYIISQVDNPITRDVYIGKVSEETNSTRAVLAQKAESIRKGRFAKKKREQMRDTRLLVGLTPNNEKDKQRSDNIKYALAEDELIKILVFNPNYAEEIDKIISANDFVTDDNKRIFGVLMERLKENKSIDISVLTAASEENLENSLTRREISVLTGLMVSDDICTGDLQEAKKIASIILSKKRDKTEDEVREMSDEEYIKYINSIKKAKKSF